MSVLESRRRYTEGSVSYVLCMAMTACRPDASNSELPVSKTAVLGLFIYTCVPLWMTMASEFIRDKEGVLV